MKGVVNTKKSSQDPRATKREMVSSRLSIYLTTMQSYDQYLTLNWSKYLNTLVQEGIIIARHKTTRRGS